ncbi:MAG: class I SAM-dependent methyltransferase [Glaciecola sp.]|jgi:SAM-dependent methyltransferase
MFTPAKTDKTIYAPCKWQEFGYYSLLKAELARVLNARLNMVYGDFLLKLGDLSAEFDFAENHLRQALHLTSKLHPQHNNVVTHPYQLPLQEHAIDAALLLHVLDFVADPHLLLRECERVLRSDGYLVISGLNPLSRAGMWRYSPFYQQHPLKQARFFSVHRVKEWLNVLGFAIKHVDYIHVPNVFSQHSGDGLVSKTSKRLEWMNSVYVIVAQKSEIPLSLVKPKLAKLKPRLQAVPASMRHLKGQSE